MEEKKELKELTQELRRRRIELNISTTKMSKIVMIPASSITHMEKGTLSKKKSLIYSNRINAFLLAIESKEMENIYKAPFSLKRVYKQEFCKKQKKTLFIRKQKYRQPSVYDNDIEYKYDPSLKNNWMIKRRKKMLLTKKIIARKSGLSIAEVISVESSKKESSSFLEQECKYTIALEYFHRNKKR